MPSPTERQSPPLKHLWSIFIWRRGSSRMLPLFTDNSAKDLCCFFTDLRRNCMDKSEMDRVIVFLKMIFDRNWPLAVNQITKPKTNLKVCFVGQTPNQNQEKWTHPLFENVESNSSPRRMSPPKIEKSRHFYFYLGDLASLIKL